MLECPAPGQGRAPAAAAATPLRCARNRWIEGRTASVTGTTATRTDLERQLIGDIWTSDEPYRNLLHLCDDIGNRWAGSASEHRAGEFLRDKLVAYGLANVRLEPVAFGAWERGEATLRMTAPVAKTFSCVALPYCPVGEVEAELIDVGNGEEEDFERLGDAVRGKIVVSAAETNPLGRPAATKLSHRTDKL